MVKFQLTLIFVFLINGFLFAQTNDVQSKNLKGELSAKVSKQNTREFEANQFFGQFSGCFLIKPVGSGILNVFRPQEADVRYSPVGTFYPLMALIALKDGNINRLFNYLYWNKRDYGLLTWNRNQTLQTALKDSVEWYFEGLADMTSRKEFADVLSNLNYGNADVSIDDFWSDSVLQISPREQLTFWEDFTTKSLPFKKENLDFVEKKLMIMSNSNVVVYGQEGTSGGSWFTGKQRHNFYGETAWFLGYVTSSTQTNVFVCHLDGTRKKNGRDARNIAFRILRFLKVLP